MSAAAAAIHHLWVQKGDARRNAPQRARCADSGRSPDRNGTARPDPQETFLATPADRRVGQKAVIRVRLLDIPTARSRQLIEQPLRFFQIGGVEALGEPAVNRREQVAGLGPPPLFTPQPGEARRGTEFPSFCVLLARDRECIAEARPDRFVGSTCGYRKSYPGWRGCRDGLLSSPG